MGWRSEPVDHSARVYDDITQMLPNEANPSPLVRLNRLAPAGSNLWAKLEWLNPFGSVKDRAAWAMIEDLERRGELGPSHPGRGIVEPTSGNTGLSLAAIAGVRGYPMLAVVPAKVPAEKKVLLQVFGAQVEVVSDALCPLPGEDGTIGLAKTHARASAHRYVMPNQYENWQNVEAHIRTTGPEIWRQTGGKVTHVFTSLGTCGTVTGLGKVLKERNPAVQIVAVQPSAGHDVPGIRNVSELDVSKLYDPQYVDQVLEIDFELAYTTAAELARHEGLRAGPSSGLIFEGARRTAQKEPVPCGVMIFCDDVFKYVSNMLQHVPGLKAEP
jgi:cysteine synthase